MNGDAAVASVQTRSHLAVLRRIAFHVGVEEKQIAATHFHAPYLGIDRTMAGIDLHLRRCAVFPDGRFHTELADLGLQVLFVAPAVPIETPAEKSLHIKQPPPDQTAPTIE